MAKNAIRWLNIEPVAYDEYLQVADFKITFQYKHSSTTYVKYKEGESGSLRIYYRNETAGTASEHVDITKEDINTLYFKRHKGKRYTKVVYVIKNVYLTIVGGENTLNTFLFRAHLRLYDSSDHDKLRKTYKSEKWRENIIGIAVPPPVPPTPPPPKMPCQNAQKLFEIATYTASTENDDDQEVNFVDFTDCITLPSYDVVREDVTESWDDANYNQHIIVPNKKIKGKFSMIFNTMERYNQFMDLIYQAKQNNTWSPGACVELKVQINNELDYTANKDDQGNIVDNTYLKPLYESGNFTIKIDSNPWVKPIIGHFDKYSPINVTIEQVDESD